VQQIKLFTLSWSGAASLVCGMNIA